MLLPNWSYKPVFFDLFHAATHFATQFILTTPSEDSSKAYQMQLCLQNRKSQWLKNKVQYHYVEQHSFVKFMHMEALLQWERPVYKSLHSTTPCNYTKSQVNHGNQISNLQTHHILTSQSYSRVAKRNSTVMAIITLKT